MDTITGTYQHYKGNIYRVVCLAKHSESLEDMVIYKDASDDSKIWARPASMWNEIVNVNGQDVPRFKRIEYAED